MNILQKFKNILAFPNQSCEQTPSLFKTPFNCFMPLISYLSLDLTLLKFLLRAACGMFFYDAYFEKVYNCISWKGEVSVSSILETLSMYTMLVLQVY